MTSGGDKLTAPHVIVTIPLTVLQQEKIKFTPALPDKKRQAIHGLGAGIIEKVGKNILPRFLVHKSGLHLEFKGNVASFFREIIMKIV